MPCGSASSTRFIYGLHGGDGVIRYVGMSRNPHCRLKQHVREAIRHHNGNRRKEAWIRSALANGCEVQCVVLQQCSDDDWQNAERQWISRWRGRLTNLADGGQEPVCPDETRRRNASILNSHRDKPLFLAKRWFAWAARNCVRNSDMQRAERMAECVALIEYCKGSARDRLRRWAAERFGNGEENHKGQTGSRQTA